MKMVHNGIEYGDIQLICEAYQLLKDGLGLSADELHEVFAEWNKGELDSYLIEITAAIFAKKDEDGAPMVDKILDTAGQKGTGKWTAISALDLGMPVTLIGESVFARCLSALKDERVAASKILTGPKKTLTIAEKKGFIEDVRRALYCSKLISMGCGGLPPRSRLHERWKRISGIAERADARRESSSPPCSASESVVSRSGGSAPIHRYAAERSRHPETRARFRWCRWYPWSDGTDRESAPRPRTAAPRRP